MMKLQTCLLAAGAALGMSFATVVAEPAPRTEGPAEVVSFWRDAGPAMWFAKDPAFDRRFREQFADLHESAARGELESWQATPIGSLALLILLDQYPRNSFRDTPRMYATDSLARHVARQAIDAGHLERLEPAMRTFVILPFAHSESLADQDYCVALARRLGEEDLRHAEHHRDIVQRFGRFPHRNPILGRPSTAAETRYLAEGGYRG